MAKNFNERLTKLLKKDLRFVDEDTEELLRNEIISEALKIDKNLIELLIGDPEVKKKFFVKIKDCWVFNANDFVSYIQDKNFLIDSYTKFKNKIGLNIKGRFLNERKEVSLVWPFKDCVLEGGMTKEDQKRNEIFFNEILAKDEIDRLLDPKVLTNFKRYSKKGEEKIKEIKRGKDGTIKDNLIIKGNNLLALHSLKKEFQGKIKLIYIDPPYNTKSDSFNYNDKFSHSTWLTFMKNRLEIAKELLREDGLIFVQADYNEAHYLKILLDEIFGRQNFINEIIWKRKFGNANETKRLATAFDNIYLYSKSINYDINLIREKDSKHVQDYIKNRFTKKDVSGNHAGRLWMPYPMANPGKPTKSLIYEYKGYNSPPKGWRMKKETLEKLDKEGRLFFPTDKSQRIQEKKFLDEYDGQPVDALWVDIFVINSQSKEAIDFDGQKPEDLLKRILLMGSNEEDIVLDYHLGSGTTCAVAHKMNRQYIGVEQINYGEKDSVVRIKEVIKGDQSGISKKVNWAGGGDFVYCELMEYNQEVTDKIQNSKTTSNLLKTWDEMCEKYFLNYDVNIKDFNDNKKDFEKLTLKKQKDLLMEMLNKNQLYVNLSEINDSQFNVSKEDKELNKIFYGQK